MSGVTPFALFATAILTPVAVVVVASALVRRRRAQAVGRWRAVGAALSALFLVGSGLALAGWALPDAYDRLPASERRAIGPALDATPACGMLPFARVLRVEVRRSSPQAPTLHYTCGLTHLGLPRFSNQATCADGTWRGPGLRDQWNAGRCDVFVEP